MTYTESIKSGHIAVWNEFDIPFRVVDIKLEDVGVYNEINAFKFQKLIMDSSIYAVNAINHMIDSARDL